MDGGDRGQERYGRRGDPSVQDQGSADGRDEVARGMMDLARRLEGEDDTQAMLADLVAVAVAEVIGAEEGSVLVVTGRRDVTSFCPTSELPKRVDALQAEIGEGPCRSSVFEQETVRVSDLRTETRWPKFADRALEMGVCSMLSIQLYVEGDNLGALNLFSSQAGAFTDESEHIGLMLAAHGAIALAGAQKHDQLRKSVQSRDLIGQAKGILMERHKINAQQAFEMLLKVSQDHNLKLHAVADDLAATGQLPQGRRHTHR